MRFFYLVLLPQICVALYNESTNVKQLTAEELKTLQPGIWLIQFYSSTSKQCKNFAEDYEKLAKTVSHFVTVAAVATSKKDETKELPYFHLIGLGTPKVYSGKADNEEILKFVYHTVRSVLPPEMFSAVARVHDKHKILVRLNDDNFEEIVMKSVLPWMVVFYVPWCETCERLENEWLEAAEQLEGKIQFGILDATFDTKTPEIYSLEIYPSIVYFPYGPKNKDNAIEYLGERTSAGIINWYESIKNTKVPDVVEITSEAILKEACTDAELTVVSFLPKLLDCQSECRNAFLNTIRKVAFERAEANWCWIWSAEGAQKRIEKALDIGVLGYPAMAVVDVKKMVYYMLDGPFSYEGITQFLNKVKEGEVEALALKKTKLPKIETIKKWDGKDADVQALEKDVEKTQILVDTTLQKDEL